MAPRRDARLRSLGRHLVAGLVAGLPAGLVMAAYFSFIPGPLPGGRFAVLRLIAGVVGAQGVGWGLFVHLLASVLFATVFSWFVRPRVPTPNLLAWSTFYGVGLFLVMVYVVLPLVYPAMYAALAAQPWNFFLAHLVYGGVVGFALAAWRTRRHWAPGFSTRVGDRGG